MLPYTALVTQEDRLFLRDFFRAVGEGPLEPDDPRYVPLYEEPELARDDPVELLARGIEWTPGGSAQLFSGFRGTGKSTELRRLRRRLREAGFLVVLIDIEDYVNLSVPIDVSDFLMAVAGTFSDALKAPELLGEDASKASYWERLAKFLKRTRIEFEELSFEGGVAGTSVALKAALKSDPDFKQRLQERMAGHLGALVQDVGEFLRDVVRRLKERHGDGKEAVLLIDSLERLRGTSTNAEEVHQSVETLFAGHADKLHLPHLHVVYTVPPYLKVRYPNLGGLFKPGGLLILPAVKVRDEKGAEYRPGFDAIERIVSGRGKWRRLLGEREALDRIIRLSGGHLRDLLRLLAEVIRRAGDLPVPAEVIDAAVDQVRNEFLPIASKDGAWLGRVARTHDPSLEDVAHLPHLARFFDTHMVLCYRNGREWYDVHPLIADVVGSEGEARPKADGGGGHGD